VDLELNAKKKYKLNKDHKNIFPETVEYYNQSKDHVRGCTGPDG